MENEIVFKIAQKLRATRMKRNFTIQQLAEKTKLTKGLLSKIENSRTLPSLPVLVNLVTAMDVSLKEFFEDMALTNGKTYIVIGREEQSRMEREGRSGFEYNFILAHNLQTSSMEVVLLRVKPGATGRPTTTDGFELKYMISGACDYKINNETVQLKEGDSLFFDATVPHLPINTSDTDAVMLVIYFLSPKQ